MRREDTLLALARVSATVAQDDALDVLNQLTAESLRKAESRGEAERLKTIPNLDRATLRLRDAVRVVLDMNQPDEKLRAAIFALVPRKQLEEDIHTVDELSRGEDETHYYENLVHHSGQMRRFLPTLLQTIEFSGTAAGRAVLEALAFLRRREGKREVSMDKAPRAVITNNWHKLVLSEGAPDHRFHALCTLERLRDGLHRRDIFLTDSQRWGDPRAKLLQGEAWREARPAICRTLGRQVSSETELQALEKQLDAAYQRAGESLASHTEVRIEKTKGRDRLCVTPLDKLDQPDSLIELREQVNALSPRVDLPEPLLEVQALTGFADEF